MAERADTQSEWEKARREKQGASSEWLLKCKTNVDMTNVDKKRKENLSCDGQTIICSAVALG